jgi:hypothetical protein
MSLRSKASCCRWQKPNRRPPSYWHRIGTRFKFPSLNQDEALTIGFVDRETKRIHAGHLCYGVLSQSNIPFMDSKTGVMNLETASADRNIWTDGKNCPPISKPC